MGGDGAVLTEMRGCEVRWGTLGKNLEKKTVAKNSVKRKPREKKTKGNLNHTSVLLPSQFTCIFCQSRTTRAPRFFPCFFFSHCFFPHCLFSKFFSHVFHLTLHSLTPVSTAPSPHIPIYPRSCVVCFVYLPEDRHCHETFSCKTQKVSFKFCSRTIIYMQTEAEEGPQNVWDETKSGIGSVAKCTVFPVSS